MPEDKSTGSPGGMGWGVDNMTLQQWHDEEKKQIEFLGRVVPERLMRSTAKTPNLELLQKVVEIQKTNGIDSGFCFLFLVEAIFGSQFRWKAQKIGSCVASGDMRTTAYRMLAEVFLLNDPEELPGIDITGKDSLAFFAPYSYRAGRREGGLNGGDGSFCGAQIKGKMKWGHLPCSTDGLDSDDLPEPQSTSLYRKWGNSNSLLEQYASKARKYPLMESEKVREASDSHELLTTHYKPQNICSNWGFAPDYQHPTWKLSDGSPVWIYKRRGSWAHNMSVIGCVMVADVEYVIIENSWGMGAHKNGSWFAIKASLFDSWLRSAECQSVGEMDMSDNPPAFPDIG